MLDKMFDKISLYRSAFYYYLYSNWLNSTKITLFQKHHGKQSEGGRCFLVLGLAQIKWEFGIIAINVALFPTLQILVKADTV